MKFEVINNNGQVIMWTNSIDCIPAPDELKSMYAVGYRHKINNKIINYDKVDEVVGRTIPLTFKSEKAKSRKLF